MISPLLDKLGLCMYRVQVYQPGVVLLSLGLAAQQSYTGLVQAFSRFPLGCLPEGHCMVLLPGEVQVKVDAPLTSAPIYSFSVPV